MRIGILTLQGAINYGAVLQALALSEFLSGQGHDVEVIDYYTPEVYGFYDYHILSRPISLRSVASKTLRRRRNEREFKAFELFRRNHLRFSNRCTTEREFQRLCNGYDAVICGSDQVWNPKANGGLLDAYFLGLVDGSTVRKISYAASFGNILCADGLEEKIRAYLLDYAAISVREEEAVGFVSSLTSQPVVRVIDPSMLLDADDYAKFEEPFETPHDYILTYMLQSNDAMTSAVEYVVRQTGLPVISLGRKMKGSRFVKDIGPGEFLRLYRNATAVITNSFHGTAFSLLYAKPFATYGNGNYNSRMETLLSVAQQEHRFMNGARDCERCLKLLVEPAEPGFETKVQQERIEASRFLNKALGCR